MSTLKEKANKKRSSRQSAKVIETPSVIKNENIEATKEAIEEANKPLTLSDLLAEQRKKAEQEKTDAAKMQKYYALTDAFSALGKIGGAAIGGAVGGNAMDSAPAVAEYQPSRGYIDAFERAKQANDRLRAIDDKDFNLALREEDRSYRQQEAKLERGYRKQLAIFESELRAAQAQKDAELELEIKTKIENLNHEHKMALEKLKGDNAIEEKMWSKAIVDSQMAGKNSGYGGIIGKDVIPVRFSNRKVVNIPTGYYNEIANSLMGRDINGKYIDKSNIRQFIEDNPELINEYLVDYGLVEAPAEQPVEEQITESPAPKKKTLKERAAEYGKLTGGVVPQGAYGGFRYKNADNNTEDKSTEEESLEDYNARFKSNRKR